jgi:uncharacterized protein (UPF0335 family)
MAKPKAGVIEEDFIDDDDDLVGGAAPPAKQSRKAKTKEAAAKPGSNSGKALQAYIQRVIALESEKKGIAEDIKQVYTQLKGEGFDMPTTREMVKLTLMDTDKRREKEELRDLYLDALDLI